MPAPKLIGLRIDIETRSSADVKLGAYRYSEDPDFKVLITCYAPLRQFAGGKVAMGQPRALTAADRSRFVDLVLDPTYRKDAYNANFERVCLSRDLGLGDGQYIDPLNWHCSAVLANVNGVSGSLDEVARAVRSPSTKDSAGKRLINFFSKPIPVRSKHGCGCVGFHEMTTHPEEAHRFIDYCKQDVLTEASVAAAFPETPADVQAQYEADQRINDRGFRHHKRMSHMAVVQVAAHKDKVMDDLRLLTGVDNPNSNPQMQAWLTGQGYPMESLDKDHRAEALADALVPPIVADALNLKSQASLTSVTKHQAALRTRCRDGRIRGSLQFFGAHTGREAGRGIQPQNLPRYEAPLRDAARLLHGTAGADAPLIAKGTVRGSIIPARDHVFVTCDYNAIEARVLGGLAGERWINAEFAGDGKYYEATAATMFGVDKIQMVAGLKQCGKCGRCSWCDLRAKAKVAALALGYAGGAGALVTMGAEAAGIDVGNYPQMNAEWKSLGMPGKFFDYERDQQHWPELLRLRDLYRDASPMTTRFWKLCAANWDVASAGGVGRFGQDQCIAFMRDGRHNRMVLPSGRSIWYRFARSHADPDRPERIDRRTFIGKGKQRGHIRVDTHGGKLTENVTQAVARDLLFDLIMRIEAKTAVGWPGRIVLHVHDEVVIEVPKASADQVLADTLGLMAESPSWGNIFALKGAGDIMERYGK